MESLILTNATLFTGDEVLETKALWLENGLIKALIDPQELPAGIPVRDLAGARLIPGLVDFQLYGGSTGFFTRDLSVDSLANMYQTHLLDGTTTIVPTLFSTSLERILRAIEAVQTYWNQGLPGVAGLHVEGPYLNPSKRGAHSPAMVRPPSDRELDVLAEKGKDVIKVMTIAPECFDDALLARLQKTGWAISAGHTDATYEQLNRYFDQGFHLATHLYNAMRPFEGREPGVVGTLFDRPDVHASIIVDGFHCDYASVRIAKKLLGERLFLISDATFAHYTGGRLELEGFTLNYDGQRFVNDEGRLAGSAITLLEAVKKCVEQVGIEPAEAIRMATAYPARQLQLDHRLGYLRPGYEANLVALSADWRVQEVWVAGQSQAPDLR
ncbi:N-acetylglucosamine-6-phosphate deacetylase [Rhabdobacter roseus]|uniref:N-acetylglucosamine-6-phosphate deacetylase n=1 Tax=Rhabdobacter roseus TaxID=1655419 RepID=A0A840TLT9_9BACT|nr:N-acetylglucosamine-6-phosphate deacetylase [Rhabdobacter roseus]MBB5284374.1 N-acetylglucosamine-6-phosphate deacetylase [Rhabdobacter roseus]